MAKPILERPRIMPRIGQGIAAGMPEHVTVNQEGKAGALTDALYQPIDGVWCEWAAPFGRKDEATVRELPAQLPQCSDLVSTERVYGRLAVLTRRTCSEAERPNSTWDHSRSQISCARRPCRKAIRISVASR
jgi:hypothetical protein